MSDAVNEARGNPGKRARKTPIAEPVPAAGIQAPKHMRAKGKRFWLEVAGYLADSRIVRVSDRNALARYCETLADYVKVTANLDKQGHVYTTESNHGSMQRISPYFLVQERLAKRLQDMEDRFGLTPASRHQILARMAAGTQPSLPLPGTQNTNDQTTGAGDAPVVIPTDPLDFFSDQTRH